MDLRHATQDAQRRRTRRRADPEHLVHLAESLPPADAQLVLGRYAEGLSYRDLAYRHRTDARWVRRRIERLTQRMLAPEYRFTVLHAKQLPPALRKTARLLFLQGQTLRDTARATGQTLHRVRTDRATLQTLARAAG